jgi:hypothetical protein
MRRFRDRDGQDWDVVIGRESWGTQLALFVPATGQAPVRQAPLAATATDAAMQELGQFSDADVQKLLDESVIKDEEQP